MDDVTWNSNANSSIAELVKTRYAPLIFRHPQAHEYADQYDQVQHCHGRGLDRIVVIRLESVAMHVRCSAGRPWKRLRTATTTGTEAR